MIIPVETIDIVEVDDNILFFSEKYNALITSKYGDNYASFVCEVDEENKNRLFSKILYLNGYIILVPYRAKKFYLYNLQNKSIKSIAVPYELCSKIEDEIRISIAYIYNGLVYLFPERLESIWCLDINDVKFTQIVDWKYLLNDNIQFFNVDDAYFRFQSAFVNNRIYIPFCNMNGFLIFDFIDYSYNIVVMDTEYINGYNGIDFNNGCLYFAPRHIDMPGAKWDIENKHIQYLSRCNDIPVGIVARDDKYTYYTCTNYSFVKVNSEKVSYYDVNNKYIIVDDNRVCKMYSSIVDINRNIIDDTIKEDRILNLESFIKMIE